MWQAPPLTLPSPPGRGRGFYLRNLCEGLLSTQRGERDQGEGGRLPSQLVVVTNA